MLRYLLSTLLALLPLVSSETTKPNSGTQTLGYLFGFTTSSLILPIIPSCPTPMEILPITPLDGATQDTQAPFNMIFMVREQLLSANGTTSFRTYAKTVWFQEMKDLQRLSVPFLNGTQFIACSWASNLVSGGCQDLFTVVPSLDYASGFATPNNSCRSTVPTTGNDNIGAWAPPLNKTIGVTMEGAQGVVSEVGWPPSCTDLRFTPQNGTPPYTLVVGPMNQPPVNITSQSTSTNPKDHAMNYTIRLTHGQAFMASLFDAAGNSWAVGPLHSGQRNDVSCLAVRTGRELPVLPASMTVTSAIGAIVGGTIGALVLGLLGGYFGGGFWRKKKARKSKKGEYDGLDPYTNPRPAGSTDSLKARGGVTPFLDIDAPHGAQAYRSSVGLDHYSGAMAAGGGGTHPVPVNNGQEQNVYVVHADSGGEDLHIKLPNPRARVIEMPPEYIGQSSSGGGGGGGEGSSSAGDAMSQSGTSTSAGAGAGAPLSPLSAKSEKDRLRASQASISVDGLSPVISRGLPLAPSSRGSEGYINEKGQKP